MLLKLEHNARFIPFTTSLFDENRRESPNTSLKSGAKTTLNPFYGIVIQPKRVLILSHVIEIEAKQMHHTFRVINF